ncbi:MAG: sigma-70 family RNA polymerase sigma factor [Planctomycetota bacterium]|nr:sigma-70 family RNA polymerase sigma factor [Planctomycetota bacterium]
MSDERIEAIPTQWSMIRRAHLDGKPENATDARRQMVLRYSVAIRRYVGAIVRSPEEADELSQDVVMRMMRGDFGGADPERGRFRDLLKTAVRNMIRNHWDKSNRRRSVDFDLDLLAEQQDQARDAQWTAAWQKTLLDHTWARMKSEQDGKGNAGYQALRLRAEFPEASSEELAEKLSQALKTPVKADAYRQTLRRARIKFAEHLFAEIRAGLDDDSTERIEEELVNLELLEIVRDFMPDKNE